MPLFNQFNLETPESVELEFTLAGIGNRAYALFIDYCILWGTLGIISILGLFLIVQITNGQMWLLAIYFLIIFTIYVGYFVFFETIWQGQTPGKKITKIRVISNNGQRITLPQATLRTLLRPVDDLLFIGAIMIIFSKQEKRIGDWLAGTLVIQEAQNQSNYQIKISPETQKLVEFLEENVDISRLTVEDFVLVREYLQRKGQMLMKAKNDLARELGYLIKDKIALSDIPDNVTASVFLEAVYIAYQRKFSN